MKKIYILFLVLMSSFLTFAQETDTESNSSLDLGADIVSRYVWRGMTLSAAAAVQPSLSYTYKGLTIGSWASYTLAKDPYQEVDVFLSYNKSFFTFTVNDYFFLKDSIGTKSNYFDFDQLSTRHLIEGIIEISDIPNLPLSLTIGVMLYGADLDANDKNYYSSYIELAYNFAVGETEASAFIGLTPSEGLYSDDFNVVNIGINASREITVSDKFSFPLFGSLSFNPYTENIFFVVGISF